MSVLNRIDPEYRSILTVLPLIDLEDIPAARGALTALFAAAGPTARDPDIEVTDHLIPGLSGSPDVLVRSFQPKGATAPLPALLWIQGGGYVLGAPDLDDGFCQQTAREQGCHIFSVSYRRAPEYPYPAASDDCFAAAQWLFAEAAALGLDPDRIVVGGASAGGGAAAGLALRARDQGRFAFSHQLLIYPMLDDRCDTSSARRVSDPELWNGRNNALAWSAYLGAAAGGEGVSPYAAPARAGDLSNLPPATIFVGELDAFLDEDIDFARRLIEVGVQTELHLYPAVHHGFDIHNPAAQTSLRFFGDRAHALGRAFG